MLIDKDKKSMIGFMSVVLVKLVGAFITVKSIQPSFFIFQRIGTPIHFYHPLKKNRHWFKNRLGTKSKK